MGHGRLDAPVHPSPSPLRLFAAGRRDPDQGSAEALQGRGHASARPHRHGKPLRHARIFGSHGRRRHPAHHRLHASHPPRRPGRTLARPRPPRAVGHARLPGEGRARLRKPHEAFEQGLPRTGGRRGGAGAAGARGRSIPEGLICLTGGPGGIVNKLDRPGPAGRRRGAAAQAQGRISATVSMSSFSVTTWKPNAPPKAR